MPGLDPANIVDREPESRRFEDLLSFGSQRRALTVSDDSGRGKSTLLLKLRFLCEFRHEVPVALVPLEEYDDHPDEFELVHDIVKQLKRGGVVFDAFDALARARAFHDVDKFRQSYASVRGTVDAGGAFITGNAQVAGTIFNIEHADNVASVSWTEEADREAKDLSLAAFFAELTEAARTKPIVMLFDTVDNVTDQLRRWIFLQLIKRGVLADQAEERKLVVVLAGNKVDAPLRATFADTYDVCFDSIEALGNWELKDTARLFEVHDQVGLAPDVVEFFHRQIIAREVSLTKALVLARAWMEKEGDP